MADQIKAITKKSENISEWYNDVIVAAKLAEHGPSKGSIIMRPYGYAIWDSIQQILDRKIKNDLGAQNTYFPLFIPHSFLQKEKTHVEGFSPELAVVTHGGGEELTEALVVRPTSETIMYDAFSRWIQSFRDLPLKVNQWCNVVRWEKRPQLFIRGTEFLWQEGHTAHTSNLEAETMVYDALQMYVDTYQEHLAIFGYAGRKSESEKFAGADKTLTYEMLMPDGKAIQGCTSHNLGQNFAKAFDVMYQDENGARQYVWQTSWGFSTRSIGPLIMVHGDDNGLVLPPKVAPVQVTIIPIYKNDQNKTAIIDFANQIKNALPDFRTRVDETDQSVGWKFSQADLEGIPVRIEIGLRELEEQKVKVVRRDTKEATVFPIDNIAKVIENLLDLMHLEMYKKSQQQTIDMTHEVETFDQFRQIMDTTRGFIKAFWCEDAACEAKIKEETKATTRCLPFDTVAESGQCVHCNAPATHRWIFAQSY